MNTTARRLLVAAVGLALGGPSMAAGGIITLQSDTLSNILGATPVAESNLMTTVMDTGNLKATVLSQAFSDGGGRYAYLYQILNTGTTGNSPVQQFTLWPFFGADDDSNVGTLSGTPPAGFSSGGGQDPRSTGYVLPLSSGAQISFYYTLPEGKDISIGEQSLVMYVVSELPPDEIWGSVIDGGSGGEGLVAGPIPEPATVGLLVLGALGLLRARRRK
jgi:hypothetical protein